MNNKFSVFKEQLLFSLLFKKNEKKKLQTPYTLRAPGQFVGTDYAFIPPSLHIHMVKKIPFACRNSS